MVKIVLLSVLLLIVLVFALRSVIHWYLKIDEILVKLDGILSELRSLSAKTSQKE